MYRPYSIKLLPVFFLLLLSGCKKEELPLPYEVDPAFEPYVQLFIQQGEKRGHIIDFSDTGLLVEFSDRIVNDASGYCHIGQHHIVIDKAEWTMLSHDAKEFLIFHELGHCELNRGHTNEVFGNGLWKSMMRGSPLSGTQKFKPVPFYGFRKEYYRDELFNSSAPAPAWSTYMFNYEDIPVQDTELLIEKTDLTRVFEFVENTGENYELDVNFSGIGNVPYVTELRWGSTSKYYYIAVYNNFGTYTGVFEQGKRHHLFYHPAEDDLSGEPFNNITVRQHDQITQIYFNKQFIFSLDALSSPLTQIVFEAKDNNDVLVGGFKVDAFRLSRIH